MTFTINGKNIYQIGSKSEKKINTFISSIHSSFSCKEIISTALLVSEDIWWLIVHIVWFQKISIPLPRMVLPIRPPHPLGISVPEGSCITPHPPGISYFPFHGLYLPHLEIIERVPLKINCSHSFL